MVTIEAAPPVLTTRAEMASISSTIGIDLRIDDDDDGVIDVLPVTGEEQSLLDAIEEASDEAYMRLEMYYTPEVLETSRWVRRRVSYIALHILSKRRGNPGNYCDEFERYMKQFQEVADGYLQIPRLPKSDNFQPSMSNTLINHRFPRRNVRVVQETSRGGTDSTQELDVFFGAGGFGF